MEEHHKATVSPWTRGDSSYFGGLVDSTFCSVRSWLAFCRAVLAVLTCLEYQDKLFAFLGRCKEIPVFDSLLLDCNVAQELRDTEQPAGKSCAAA